MTARDEDRSRSIRQRINNRLRKDQEDVQFGLQRYAIERFLYRLGASAHRERFVLKGGSLLALWGADVYRPTRDMDFTGFGSTDEEDIVRAFRDVCLQPGEPAELRFDAASLRAKQIRVDSEYKGLRLQFRARLGNSAIPMQIDVGFADAIQPPAEDAEFPTLLDDPPPRIRVYPREAVIAEKLHALVTLGEVNSRLKDFHDISALAGQFHFDGPKLGSAIEATFRRRSTRMETARPAALAPEFYLDPARSRQWRAFLDRNGLASAPIEFRVVGEVIIEFLLPVLSALSVGRPVPNAWRPGGPWT